MLPIIGYFGLQRYQSVPCELETEPATSHAGRDLQQVGRYPFIEPSNSLVGDDYTHCVENGLVLVAHAGHGVDLEASAQNVASELGSAELAGGTRTKSATHKGYVQVCATAPDIAPAPSLPKAVGFSLPSGVKYCRTLS